MRYTCIGQNRHPGWSNARFPDKQDEIKKQTGPTDRRATNHGRGNEPRRSRAYRVPPPVSIALAADIAGRLVACLVGSGIGPLESGSRGSSSGNPPARAAKNLSRAPTPRLHRCSKASIEKMVPHQPAISRNAPTASQSTLSQPSGPSGPPRPAQAHPEPGQTPCVHKTNRIALHLLLCYLPARPAPSPARTAQASPMRLRPQRPPKLPLKSPLKPARKPQSGPR